MVEIWRFGKRCFGEDEIGLHFPFLYGNVHQKHIFAMFEPREIYIYTYYMEHFVAVEL